MAGCFDRVPVGPYGSPHAPHSLFPGEGHVLFHSEFGELSLPQVKRRHFCDAIYINASFYQDRLGTSIGKTQKRVAFPQFETLQAVISNWKAKSCVCRFYPLMISK